jgi:hypothetical protein
METQSLEGLAHHRLPGLLVPEHGRGGDEPRGELLHRAALLLDRLEDRSIPLVRRGRAPGGEHALAPGGRGCRPPDGLAWTAVAIGAARAIVAGEGFHGRESLANAVDRRILGLDAMK